MKTHKLAAIIFALFLITGCQQSQLTANKPLTDQTIIPPEPQDQYVLQPEPKEQHQTSNNDQGT